MDTPDCSCNPGDEYREPVIGGISYNNLVILTFIVQHAVLLLKIVLAELIDDEPEWVQSDMDTISHRVTQTEAKIEDMKLMERLSDHYDPKVLLEDVLH